MVLKIGLQCGMVAYELLVFHKRRVAAKLLGDFPVTIEKLIESREFFTSVVFARFLAAVVAIFLAHEIVRVFFYLLAYAGMILQKGLQFRMLLHVILIVHQLWSDA